jgi:hypothetical protein
MDKIMTRFRNFSEVIGLPLCEKWRQSLTIVVRSEIAYLRCIRIDDQSHPGPYRIELSLVEVENQEIRSIFIDHLLFMLTPRDPHWADHPENRWD